MMPLTAEQIAQTPSEQMMLKLEGKDVTIYSTVDKRRHEYHDKVVIERVDLRKTFILDMEARTYSIQPYQEGTATFSYSITREKPEPERTKYYRYDQSLFDIPADFKLVGKE